jgi:hypothetical protein
VGFPIRKSADQSFLAAPHGLSQRSTSFIASQRQGIHQTPLRHLIALIINTHRDPPSGSLDPSGSTARPALNKKDQLALRSLRRRAVKPADKSARGFVLVQAPKPVTGFAWDPGVESRRSDRSPLHDVRQRRHPKAGPSVTQTDKSRTMTPPGWWSQTGSNRRPPACKAGALPTELWPRRCSRIRPHAVIPHKGRPFRSPAVV